MAITSVTTGPGSRASTMQAVTKALNTRWHLSVADLKQQLSLPEAEIPAAVEALIQSGRAVYDLQTQSVRWRDLMREPLKMESLRFQSEQESLASALVTEGLVKDAGMESGGEYPFWRAQIADKPYGKSRWLAVSLTLDTDLRIREAQCACDYFFRHQLRRGPCEHILALRQVVYQR